MRFGLLALLLTLPAALHAQPQVLLSKMLGVAQQHAQGAYRYTMEVVSPDTMLSATGTVRFRRAGGPAAERPVTDLRVENADGVWVYTPSSAWMYSPRTAKTYVDETGEELMDTFYPHLINPFVWPMAAMLPMMGADTLWTEAGDGCTFVRSAFTQIDGLRSLDFCLDEAGTTVAYEMQGGSGDEVGRVHVRLADLDLTVALTNADFAPPADAPVVPMGEEHGSLLLAVGEQAPAFTLKTADGADVSLADFAGRPVLLDFWGVWCVSCVEAMPMLQALHEQYGDDLVILGLSCYEDEATDPTAFARSKGLAYPILLNGETVADAYGVSSFPTYYVVGRDGTVRFAATPDETPESEAVLHAAIEAAVVE